MNYNYRIENLDCANCAAEVERAIAKIDGVNTCSISFMTQKMTIQTATEMSDELMKKIKKVIKKVEPDVTFKPL